MEKIGLIYSKPFSKKPGTEGPYKGANTSLFTSITVHPIIPSFHCKQPKNPSGTML